MRKNEGENPVLSEAIPSRTAQSPSPTWAYSFETTVNGLS